MNCKEAAQTLSILVDGSKKSSINTLVDILNSFGPTTMRSAVSEFKKAAKVSKAGIFSSNSTQSEIKPLLSKLHDILVISGKKSAITAIHLLLVFFNDNPYMDIKQLKSELEKRPLDNARPEETNKLVQHYLSRLETSYKNNSTFEVVLSELQADKNIKVAEANLIASTFTGITRKRTKKTAFQDIAKKSQHYLNALKQQSSAGGKSAA